MRTNFNRQARRVALCIPARTKHESAIAFAPVGAGSQRNADGLAGVAARIADELELSPDMLDELLWGPPEVGGRQHRR